MTQAAAAQVDATTDGTAILNLFDRYVDRIVNYDVDGWMALWDEDGVQLPPGGPMCVGKDEILRGNQGWISDRSVIWTMHIDTQEVRVFPKEGYAFARGVYGWTQTPRNGGTTSRYDGKFLTVFRRRNEGPWRVYRDCFNSNVPTVE